MADVWATTSNAFFNIVAKERNVTKVPIVSYGRQMEAEAGTGGEFSTDASLGRDMISTGLNGPVDENVRHERK
jgi:hypothetical protein